MLTPVHLSCKSIETKTTKFLFLESLSLTHSQATGTGIQI